MGKNDFLNYLSPFSWRYGSAKMRHIFSEESKYHLWRKLWVELAQVYHEQGLVSDEELTDLKKHQDDVDVDRILELEKETKHDVVAGIREFSEKAKVGGGKIHLGATSMDIVDNTDAIRMQEALILIEKSLKEVLQSFSKQIEKYASLPTLGLTHLQPAEPTTVGYRLSFYAQDLLTDWEFLQFVKSIIAAKGFKGAVGTGASYQKILGEHDFLKFEQNLMQKLGTKASLISSQVYTRKYDYLVLSVLASIASSLSKFAADLRILQSPYVGEWSEPFGKSQVGSSAMPFKKNPINAEKLCSLARYVATLPVVALENASHSYLERTLDDSANKRVVVPEAFLAVEEIVTTGKKLIEGLVVNEQRIADNLQKYAPFAATESIMIEAVKKGADRQKLHETIREMSMVAWQDVQGGKSNPMKKLLAEHKEIVKYLKPSEVESLLDVSTHVGDAPKRSLLLVKKITETLG